VPERSYDFRFTIFDFSLPFMSLGEKISTIRKNKGMSQELLAEKAGISLRTIQRIEAGVTTPRPFTLHTIAGSLNIPLEDLSLVDVRVVSNTEADKQALKLINLSAVSVILLPVIHIFIVALTWKQFKDSTIANSSGKKIISFQILWTIVTLLLVILIPLIQQAIFQSLVIGRFPPTIVMVYGVMLMVNITLTIRTSLHLQKDQSMVYPSIPSLF
jgi:transcriptional regulator with XRE-family HTH domain